MNKYLLGLGVAVCLILSASRINKVLKEHLPPYAIGECFEIPHRHPIPALNVKIVANHLIKGESDVVVKMPLFENAYTQWEGKISFQEIREEKSKKVECVK